MTDENNTFPTDDAWTDDPEEQQVRELFRAVKPVMRTLIELADGNEEDRDPSEGIPAVHGGEDVNGRTGTSTITVEKTCPACDGRGKSYGHRRCGYCHGRHTITETVTVEHDRTRAAVADAIDAAVREVLADEPTDEPTTELVRLEADSRETHALLCAVLRAKRREERRENPRYLDELDEWFGVLTDAYYTDRRGGDESRRYADRISEDRDR